MSAERGYYRHPTISGPTIVFVSEDDLWAVDTDDRTPIARRLTANPGAPAFPVFSPDGRSIAFTGRDDGPGEVYIMDAEGGTARRLTWMSAYTQVVGWTRDGQGILAATDWRQPFGGVMHLVVVPVAGGPPETLTYGPARAVSFSPDSDGVVIGRNSGDPARWKRYRGGTAGTIWIDRTGKHQFVPLVRLEGNLASPMWIGKRIYFLSDHDGHGDLYSCTPGGRGLRRHTSHKDFYVRFPSTDGRRIVYHAGADIYCFDTENERSQKVEIRLHSARSERNRRFVSASQFLESFDLHPKGHSLLSIHRGGMFSMGLWEGAPVRLGSVSKTRYRLGSWLPDGNRIVSVTDETGEESLRIVARNGNVPPRIIRGDFGRPIDLSVAPGNVREKKVSEGKERAKKRHRPKKQENRSNLVALTNHRHELILVNLDSGKSRVLDRSPHQRIHGVAWSPDSKWIAYGHASSARTSAIRLCEVATGKIATLTREDFYDGFPSFDPQGRYLYFLSWRTYNPVYDELYFDLGFPKGSRPYLLTLERGTVSPFESATETPRAPGAQDEDQNGQSENGEEFKIDLDGIADRVRSFPVPEGRYGRILGVKGRALYSSYPVVGSLDEDRGRDAQSSGVLEYWDFEGNKSGRVSDRVGDFGLSLDTKVLGIRSGDRVRALPSTFKEDPEKNKDECSRETGWIDLDRIPVAIVPLDEWKQMYREAWRLQREHFWNASMSGVDWEDVYERYLPVLERVASRTEFSDLMWEMQGELGTSHCYELGGDYKPRPNWRQGFLGVDLEFNRRSKRWLIGKIPAGDAWIAESASPLAASSADIHPGDEILAIGGESVGRNVSPFERLVNMAGRNVQVTIRRKRRGRKQGSPETITVRALSDETHLRYRDWVEQNRARVHAETRGRVGYLHIPDMGPSGYAEFHRYYNAECVRDALIVDVRFNRGGHVSQLLLEKLLRRRIGYDVSRWAEPVPYPDAAPMGPMVAMTNEYAGSDGDVFCHAFKLFGLGPLIGKRTWGGVVGMWPRTSLVDGTVTTQPEFASWFEDVGYGVENYGTDPDIEIDIRPQDYQAGRDRQMERALDSIRSLLRKGLSKKPDFGRAARKRPQKNR